MKAPCAVNLHNAVTVSQRRLGKRVAQLSSARMRCVPRCGSLWVVMQTSYRERPVCIRIFFPFPNLVCPRLLSVELGGLLGRKVP
jgi:hypothetical protein